MWQRNEIRSGNKLLWKPSFGRRAKMKYENGQGNVVCLKRQKTLNRVLFLSTKFEYRREPAQANPETAQGLSLVGRPVPGNPPRLNITRIHAQSEKKFRSLQPGKFAT